MRIAAFVSAFVCLVAAPLRAGEPVVNGKPLAQWRTLMLATNDAQRARELSKLNEQKSIPAEALPVLLELVPPSIPQWQLTIGEICDAIAKVCTETPAALPQVIAEIGKGTEHRQLTILRAIGYMNEAGRPAVPKLLQVAADSKATLEVRDQALDSIERINAPNDSVPALVKLLDDSKPRIRSRTIRTLGGFGVAAKPASARMLQLLNDPDEDVRTTAMENLGKIGPDPKLAVPALIKAMQSGDAGAAACAATGLGDMGPAAKDAIPALIKALHYQDINARNDAATALGKMGAPAVPALLATLKDQNPDVCCAAMNALGAIGAEAASAIPELEKFNTNPNEDIRINASGAVKKLKAAQNSAAAPPAGQSPVPPPAAAQQEKDYQGRSLNEWAELFKTEKEGAGIQPATALTHFGEAGYKVLGDALTGDNNELIASARDALVAPDGNNKELAVKQLVRGLKVKNVEERRANAQSIGELGTAAKGAVTALVTALNDRDLPVRYWAADALGKIGPAAKDAVPSLMLAAKHEDPDMREHATAAIAGIGVEAKEAVPMLIESYRRARNDSDAAQQVHALGQVGTPQVRNILLEALMGGAGSNTRNAAAQALGNMHAYQAIPYLLPLLKNSKEMAETRITAAEALGKMGARGSAAIEPLTTVARDKNSDWRLRKAALGSVAALDEKADVSVPLLADMLADSNGLVRIASAQVLLTLGPRAAPATPAITKVLQEKPAPGVKEPEGYDTARLLCKQVLDKIESKKK